MKLSVKTVLGSAAVAATLGFSTFAAHAQVKLGFNIEDPAGSYHTNLTEEFGDLVSEYTNGEVEIVVYPGGQQGNARESIEGMLIGTVDMARSLDTFAPIVRDVEVFGLPYLFASRDQFVKSLELPEVQDVVDRLADEGLIVVGWWENGFRHMTNNERPIVEPSDVDGLKMRTPVSVTRMDMFRMLGANPAPLAFTEVFTALQTGAFDGQENPLQLILDHKLYEVQKYLSLTKHVYNPQIVVMSAIRWNQLSDSQKEAIRRAAGEIGDKYRANGDAQDKEVMAELEGLIEINEVDFAAFQEALKPMYAEFPNQELVNAILSTLE
ncbi:MAG: TRAP transporter substrate-binding protein [Sedimentitalea sp.]|uniref:TRAP transporter substrate-binding protein n=1 Tax=Sedimentitalea sp. TaxID=2048915 RepID=UPI0032632BC4